MIKVKKLENVFGIKSVKGMDDLGAFNVIYAPNGTAKTSLSDAIYRIGTGEGDLRDVYDVNPNPVAFELNVDGRVSTEKSPTPFKVIRYSGTDEYVQEERNEYTNLVASPDILKKVSEHAKIVQSLLGEAYKILLSIFPRKAGNVSKKNLDALAKVVGTPDIDDAAKTSRSFLENINLEGNVFEGAFSVDDFALFCEPKFVDSMNNPEVQTKLNLYLDKVEKVFNESYFGKEFSTDNLEAIIDACAKQNFFLSDNRKIWMNGEVFSEQGLRSLIEKEKKAVFGSEEVKEQFDSVKKAISKKAAKTIEEAKKKPFVLSSLNDMRSFMNSSLLSLLGPSNVSLLADIKKRIDKEEKTLSDLLTNYDGKGSEFNDLWNKFKARFDFEKFSLQIENRADAISGRSLPRFVKVSKIDGRPIIDPRAKRLSTGEVRAYYLVNLILDIESAICAAEKTVVVMDDAVDSFDYKNKYAIIEYLAETKRRANNLQFIVFTHNFDFFRSLLLALEGNDIKQFFAYSDGGRVTFYDASSSPYLLKISMFNAWANDGDACKYLALIPFLRNIIQLQKGSGHDPDVTAVCRYLHYDPSTASSLDCNELQDLFRQYMKKVSFPGKTFVKNSQVLQDKENANYYSLVSSVTTEIVRMAQNVNETDLAPKIVLGLYIRLAYEKAIYSKAFERLKIDFGEAVKRGARHLERELISKGLLSNEEQEMVLQTHVVAPAYAHVNGFMYEPLIDVGSRKLIDLAGRYLSLESRDLPTKADEGQQE